MVMQMQLRVGDVSADLDVGVLQTYPCFSCTDRSFAAGLTEHSAHETPSFYPARQSSTAATAAAGQAELDRIGQLREQHRREVASLHGLLAQERESTGAFPLILASAKI